MAGSAWWGSFLLSHLPYFSILAFLALAMLERLGYMLIARRPTTAGKLPRKFPRVCIQVPMYEEVAVAKRVIAAACTISWPRDRFEVQVLDDSQDQETKRFVDKVARKFRNNGVNCHVVRRFRRTNLKAGALEEGRIQTSADFVAIFNAGFLPTADYLEQTVPHFYTDQAMPLDSLAMVQAQWGHTNHNESMLTQSQSLWLDDLHTLQMSWRSKVLGFVNFTGSAATWRAQALEDAGGWKSESNAESADLSLRALFIGYTTKFVKEIVQPAELPVSYTIFKSQQKRCTKGWAQILRMHARDIFAEYNAPFLKRMILLFQILQPLQWLLWMLWSLLLPLVAQFGIFVSSPFSAFVLYVAPAMAWLVTMTTLATMQTRFSYNEPDDFSNMRAMVRMGRLVPFVLINTGMLPLQACAWLEGIILGPQTTSSDAVTRLTSILEEEEMATQFPAITLLLRRLFGRFKTKWNWCMAVEALYAAYHIVWALFLAAQGYRVTPLLEVYAAATVLALMLYYGDDDVNWRYPIRCWPNSEYEWASDSAEEEAASIPLVANKRGKKGRGTTNTSEGSTYGAV
uniref:Glycosyltransferase 2-like domain-containing protein n=2 Tax=Pyramimonas obovata TaxID=1411642 RepID=A0A7S0MTL4_9CHLO|mmetsp:Transcript_1236/g.2469  ORF Transcript_1236/g.2469 Transcript_1236/m.2469 type:complete len:571 (+) Transcript_1236:114-1826(+)